MHCSFFAPTQAHGCRQMSTTVVSRMRSADLVFHDSAGNLGTTSTAGVNITIQQIPEPAFASSSPPPQLACVEQCSSPERDHTPLLLATTAACLRGAMFIARTRSHTPAPRPRAACVELCSPPERDHTPLLLATTAACLRGAMFIARTRSPPSPPPQLACVERCSSPERDHTRLLLVTTAAWLRGTLFITRTRSKKTPSPRQLACVEHCSLTMSRDRDHRPTRQAGQ